MADKDFALVLSGGGVTGVAWETGLLKGLRDAGLDLTGADLIVGTSAGSIVGTQIAAGLDLDVLYARQLEPPDPLFERAPAVNILQALAQLGPELASLGANQAPDEPGLAQPARAALGRHALQTATVPEFERFGIIAHRLTVSEWPERRLLITAVDVEDGRFVTWNRDSGVELVLAVASSCAVPLVWPPVTINGRRYMDGGLRSPSNADLAVGYTRVIVVAPMGSSMPMSASLLKEKAVLARDGATVLVAEADAAARAAFGPDVLDPSRRTAAAEAGLRQAATVAESLAGALALR
jgi:NTE family protein